MIEELYAHFLQHPFICTDTRKIEPNAIFFALKGDNFNGNKFAAKALENGCSYAVIDEEEYNTSDRFILVEDVLTALQQLAKHHRQQLNIPVLGITGSNGKTTTKELIRAVISQKLNTFATFGNLNNHIGVPLSLLSITAQHEFAIIEMGANHQKEIEELCQIALPEFGIITNIGKAHIEGFGSEQGIIKGKGELFDHLATSGGKAFINNNSVIIQDMAKSRSLSSISYGSEQPSDYNGQLRSVSPFVQLTWNTTAYQSENIESCLIGTYNFENILAAISIGHFFGVEPEKIKKAIEGYVPDNNRSQLLKTATNTIILDAYNANPSSVTAAIKNLHAMEAEQKFFILGDMLELGNESKTEHQGIIKLIQQLELNSGVFVGNEFKQIMDDFDFPVFDTTTEAQEYLLQSPIQNSLILIKGSRGIKLEPLADIL
jgi:UDP-N-acetylmuramoyl-tripeptide--D-alanyl-D-alanine ligase